MAAEPEMPARPETAQKYLRLPDAARLDDAIAGVDTRPVLDPDGVRNVDQHGALRED